MISFLLQHPLTMPGSSDGGAHVNTFCGADYTTRVLTEYVDDEFTFEQAVRRLSAVPAATVGLWDRGEIRPGAAADLVLLERDRLAVGAARMVRDFPAGAARMIWEQQGYRATIVNGEVVIDDGAPPVPSRERSCASTSSRDRRALDGRVVAPPAPRCQPPRPPEASSVGSTTWERCGSARPTCCADGSQACSPSRR